MRGDVELMAAEGQANTLPAGIPAGGIGKQYQAAPRPHYNGQFPWRQRLSAADRRRESVAGLPSRFFPLPFCAMTELERRQRHTALHSR
jgi:hypothetical protein